MAAEIHEHVAAVGRSHFEAGAPSPHRAKNELNRLKRRAASRARNSVFLWRCGTLAFLLGTPMSALHESRNFFLSGPVGRVEAILWSPCAGSPPRAALVCHPHPLFGGTMHNKVVYRVARGLRRTGAAVLRFNFRGVGRSQGEHAHGVGEADDARVALDWLRARFPGMPYTLAGFSFGSRVILRLGCSTADASQLIAAG